MHSAQTIDRALDLQHRTYALLIWMGEAIRRGFIRFEAAHAYTTLPEAALAWLQSHYVDIPLGARPSLEDLEPFSNLFATYLESSFELNANPGQRLYSPDAHCFCPMCSWLVAVPHLRPKKLTATDKRRARALQIDLLRSLAAEASLALPDESSERIADDPAYREVLALATWFRALLRRLEGHTDGPAVLALWRRFAWTPEGSPKRKFRLSAQDVLSAHQTLAQRIAEEASPPNPR